MWALIRALDALLVRGRDGELGAGDLAAVIEAEGERVGGARGVDSAEPISFQIEQVGIGEVVRADIGANSLPPIVDADQAAAGLRQPGRVATRKWVDDGAGAIGMADGAAPAALDEKAVGAALPVVIDADNLSSGIDAEGQGADRIALMPISLGSPGTVVSGGRRRRLRCQMAPRPGIAPVVAGRWSLVAKSSQQVACRNGRRRPALARSSVI